MSSSVMSKVSWPPVSACAVAVAVAVAGGSYCFGGLMLLRSGAVDA